MFFQLAKTIIRIYSTFLEGNDKDQGLSIAVDAIGKVYYFKSRVTLKLGRL